LRQGVVRIENPNSPDVSKKYIADMITGFGVAEAVVILLYMVEM
jgi:hypothetical protein